MTPAEALAAMPKTIKVGPHIYAVHVVDAVSGDSDARASVEPDRLVIEIINGLSSASQVIGCLLHEIYHAIWEDGNLGKRPNEEAVILRMESGTVALYRDNPKLLTWIKRGLR